MLTPWQTTLLPVIATIGNGFTVTTTASVEVQLLASVIVTVYVVVATGVTVTDALVPALPQLYVYGVAPFVALAVKVVDKPAQIVTSAPAFAVGPPVLLTVAVAVAVQPSALVTVTVYVPAVKPVMEAVV